MNDTQVFPTIRLNPGSKASDFQTANDTLRNQGGGFIELTPGAAYKMDAGFILDVGAGVGLRGNTAIFDFTGMTTGVCINLNARRRNPDNFPVPGYDGATGNYHQTRTYVGNFGMIGPGKAVTGVTAIDIDQSTGSDGVRAPRANLLDLSIEGFDVGIKHRNEAYGIKGERVSVLRCNVCLSVEPGTDSGENTLWDHCFFFNSGLGIEFKMNTDDAAMTFRNCSLDYNTMQIKHTSGYGRVHFYECHFEHGRQDDAAIPMDFSAGTGSSSKMIYRFDGGVFVFVTDGTYPNQNYPSYFNIGANVRVSLSGNPQIHNTQGSGIVFGAGKGVAGADIKYPVFAYVSDSSGSFELNGGATNGYQSGNRNVPSLLSNSAKCCLNGDPGFELSAIMDNWGDSSVFADGSTLGTFFLSSADTMSGSKCLQVPMIFGSGTSRKLSLFVPVEKLQGRDFSFIFAAKFLPSATSATKSGGNTGNGTLTMDSSTPTLSGVSSGVYQVRCTTATAGGGTLTVTDPSSNVVGTVAVGSTFNTQIKFATTAGGTDFIVGDGFDITVGTPTGNAYLDIVPVAARKIGAKVKSLTITNPGAGYSSNPTISFTNQTGLNAAATATQSGGVVTTTTMTNTGYGYSYAPAVAFSGGGSPTTTATATANLGNQIWAVDQAGTAILGSAASIPAGFVWTRYYLNSMSARLQCPLWATHVQFRFNLDSVANAGGSFLLDEFYVTPY